MVSYRRRGGGGRPPDDEHLEVDEDGAFRLLRSVGAARAGSFGGMLGNDELAALRADVAAVDPADLPAARAPEGAAAEFVGCRELTAAVHPQWKASGSWGPLVGRLRDLTTTLTNAPVSAVEAAVSSSGGRLQLDLEVVGTRPLAVTLERAEAEVILAAIGDGAPRRWTGSLQPEQKADSLSSLPSLDDDPADRREEPGWRVTLDLLDGEPVDGGAAPPTVLVRVPLEWDGGRTVAELRP